jgi:hypothetical protein
MLRAATLLVRAACALVCLICALLVLYNLTGLAVPQVITFSLLGWLAWECAKP